MLKNVFLFLLAVFPTAGFANCDFQTAHFANDLQNASSVKSIAIEIPKSKKWAVNGIGLLLDREPNIQLKWKKKFEAILRVTYPFGNCSYLAEVRQSGDWLDHLRFLNGSLHQSLDVKLKNGNIANVVKFKLFLPETRLGNNETLATLLLRKLDFIAPKTFMVEVNVNGITAPYLFQEKESKELLESMKRREGPIFEGDETLLWSYGVFENFELEPVSGAKLVNRKWAQRGNSSAKMALNALNELQYHYVNFATLSAGSNNGLFINPNERLGKLGKFSEYHAITGAMGGFHALRPHNRKYYWNALADEFEPIYYDGNVSFEAFNPLIFFKDQPIELELFRRNIQHVNFENLKIQVQNMKHNNFIVEFASLAKLPLQLAHDFVLPKLAQMIINLDAWESLLAENLITDLKSENYGVARNNFIRDSQSFGVNQEFIELKYDFDSKLFSVTCIEPPGCVIPALDANQVGDLMANQRYVNERYVILPSARAKITDLNYTETYVGRIKVRHSVGALATYNAASERLDLVQKRPDDWFLIKDTFLSGITVSMRGILPESVGNNVEQRFNEFGLTGCLTFYKVTFEATNVEVSDGACEDSLNFVSSNGSIASILISNGFADAVDIDFSELTIASIEVNGAGNDCMDVSGGRYNFDEANFNDCGDKGISVGEGSSVVGGSVVVIDAVIGASSKDFSDLLISDFDVSNVQVCLEAFQKKMEFGGASINIQNENCRRLKVDLDANSVIILGGRHFELSN